MLYRLLCRIPLYTKRIRPFSSKCYISGTHFSTNIFFLNEGNTKFSRLVELQKLNYIANLLSLGGAPSVVPCTCRGVHGPSIGSLPEMQRYIQRYIPRYIQRYTQRYIQSYTAVSFINYFHLNMPTRK